MFAIAAVITFALAFILALMSVATAHVNLLYLGLLFLSLALLAPWSPWSRRNP